jgi:alpha-tubulin suppressor-like RCC1 family protein
MVGQCGSGRDWLVVEAVGARSFGLTRDGDLFAWGENPNGTLGLPGSTQKEIPTLIPPRRSWVGVYASEQFTVGLRSDGSLWAWGENREGQLGSGNFKETLEPVRVALP